MGSDAGESVVSPLLPAPLSDLKIPELEPRDTIRHRRCYRWWSSGPVCVLLSAISYAFGALFAKLLGTRVSLFEVTAVQAAISAVITLALCMFYQIKPVMGPRDKLFLLIVRGIIGAIVFCLAYEGVLLLPLGDALTAFYTNPAFTALFTWLAGLETLSWQRAGGISGCIAGAVLVAQPPFLFGGQVPWGHDRLLGLASSLSASMGVGMGLLVVVKIGNNVSPLTITLWFHLATIFAASVPALVGYPQPLKLVFTASEILFILGIAASMILGQLLLTHGIQVSSATEAAAIRVSEVIFGYIFGAVFFHEKPTVIGILGAILIGGGVILVTRGRTEMSRNPQERQGPKHDTSMNLTTELPHDIQEHTVQTPEAGGSNEQLQEPLV